MHANYHLMENEDTQQFTTPTNQETPFLLHHSNNIHQGSSKWRSKKLKNRRMNKAARQVPKAILKLQDYKHRESALTKLSNFLLEELLTFLRMMGSGNPTERAFKRLRNVLTLFQCIAAGRETRHKFVKSSIPNFLVPLLMFKAPLEEFENV